MHLEKSLYTGSRKIEIENFEFFGVSNFFLQNLIFSDFHIFFGFSLGNFFRAWWYLGDISGLHTKMWIARAVMIGSLLFWVIWRAESILLHLSTTFMGLGATLLPPSPKTCGLDFLKTRSPRNKIKFPSSKHLKKIRQSQNQARRKKKFSEHPKPGSPENFRQPGTESKYKGIYGVDSTCVYVRVMLVVAPQKWYLGARGGSHLFKASKILRIGALQLAQSWF